MNLSDLLNSRNRDSTISHLEKLDSLKASFQAVPLLGNVPITLLCMGNIAYTFAQAFPATRIVALGESYINTAPVNVILSIIAHECVHLQIGSKVRDDIINQESFRC